MRTYSMTLRGTRDVYFSFYSLNELIEELNMRLSQREKDSGLVERLTTFRLRPVDDNGFKYYYAQNSYQNMTVECMEFED